MRKALLIACAILVVACAALWNTVDALRTEKERLTGNQTALLEDVEYYKTEAGKSAASVQRLELSYSELKDNYDDVCQTAKSLNIKIKRLEAASKTATDTKIKIQTVVRDSIVYVDSTAMRIQAFRWRDPWVAASGSIYPDKRMDLFVSSTDTLRQVVYRIPKKFLFFRWGTKAIRQEITSSNPHTTIVYTEYIELSKGRKKK